MDIQQFEKLARDPKRTREDLDQMRKNAIDQGKLDFVSIIDEVLLHRFPLHTAKTGGMTPTTASFRSGEEYFDNGKEAYLWLVGQFIRFRPNILAEYEILHAGQRSRGRRFARDPKNLFPEESIRQGDSRYYSAVGNGWYADTNLNHDGKFASLLQLSHLCRLEYEQDWNFTVHGATLQLIEHQRTVGRAQKALDALLTK